MRAYAGKKKRATKKARGGKKKEPEARKKAATKRATPRKSPASYPKKPGAKPRRLSQKAAKTSSGRKSRTGQARGNEAKRPKASARKPAPAAKNRSRPAAKAPAKRKKAAPVRAKAGAKGVNWKAAEKLLTKKSGLKPRKKAPAKKLDPRTKRRRQNKALVQRVDRLEDKRQRNRKKTLTKRARKKTAREIAQERKRIEKLRLDRERKRLKRLSERKHKVVTFADEMSEHFADLLGEAFRTNQAPATSNKRKMDKYDGRQVYVLVRRILSLESVEDIMHTIRQRVQKAFPTNQWPLWLASIHFASMGENLLGYGHSILRSDKPGADMFTAQANDSTGIWSSRIGMLDKLEELLEKYAGEAMNVIFLYHVRIMNYDRSKVHR